MEKRERFGSRLGFILISAGCAIGLGNVWKFPYITAQNGGAAFILIYVLFLILLGIPIMVAEFAVGRASRKSIIHSFHALEPKGSKWHSFGIIGVIGNYMLMAFYTVVSGWMLLYMFKMVRGDFVGLDSVQVGEVFGSMLAAPTGQIICMLIMILIGIAVCSIGLQKGVEKVTKVMMTLLIVIMIILAVRSVTLDGAAAGVEYYLKPDFSKIFGQGFAHFNSVLFAAMGQAFFTLSIGMGSMAIFGSYIGKEHRLMGEAISVTALDTLVAFTAGLIIIPACFAYNVDINAGPPLIFITLPNIFNSMPLGQLWGALFFLFMIFAALSTLVAVFENIISFGMDALKWSRKKSSWINFAIIVVISLPALFGHNIWSSIHPIRESWAILDFEDFIVSNNVLPLGSLVYVLFCCLKKGWGWDNFLLEANQGSGISFPKALRGYMTWVVPLIIIYVFVMGYIGIFG
ncbi:MAG: sodium-dependent transporter [Clostridia bacterium]|nr:sodium-dependent transporter [Clostridia bacterium]